MLKTRGALNLSKLVRRFKPVKLVKHCSIGEPFKTCWERENLRDVAYVPAYWMIVLSFLKGMKGLHVVTGSRVMRLG